MKYSSIPSWLTTVIAVVWISSVAATESLIAQELVSDYVYDFEDDNDRNYDTWPDDWSRRAGAGFPHYIDIAITDREDKEGRCLTMRLDGGAAEISSPPRRIDSRFSYYLDLELCTFETERGEQNEAWASVEFLDLDMKVVSRFESDRFVNVPDFQPIRIGPMIPPELDECFVVIRLHTSPTRAIDLFGGAQFDSISMLTYPKLIVTTNRPYNIFPELESPQITCRVSGVQDQNASLVFRLYDAANQPVGPPQRRSLIESLVELESSDGESTAQTQGESFRTLLDELIEEENEFDLNREITVKWNPPVTGLGFYRAKLDLMVGDRTRMSRSLTMAVVDTDYELADDHFGWTLPAQATSTPLPQLTEMIKQSGVRWIKYPVWFGRSDDASAEWIAEFAERLAGHEIELVGMLIEPPEEHLDSFSQSEPGIASLIREPDSWPAAVNHVLTRLSLKVKRWQLGGDDDITLIGYPDLYEKLNRIRQTLGRYAKDIEIGITWKWLHHIPASDSQTLPWDFSINLADPPLTETELIAYLELDAANPDRSWSVLQPLSREGYSLETRIRDLIGRMMRIKMASAKGFVLNPFSDRNGLLQADGSPGELWVPWRTTSFQLAGMNYLGSFRLPNQSENYIFENGETATILVWNDSPTEEVLYLGEEAVVTDIWGRKHELEMIGHRHVLHVGELPVFVSGVDLEVAKFRINFKFDRETLANIFGQRQMAGVSVTNVFEQGVSGKLSLNADKLWARPIELSFKTSSQQTFEREFPIVLRPFASTGQHTVRVDVELDTDQRYQFSLYRDMQVGFGRVELEYRLDEVEDGLIVAHATLINNSFEVVNFDCSLLVPGQRRQRKQVLRLGHGRETIDFYILPSAEVQSGASIWLRAEEIRGNRVLNKHFELTSPSDVVEPQ